MNVRAPVAWLLTMSLVATACDSTEPRVLDTFDHPGGWTAQPSDGVALTVGSDTGYRGRAMRLDIDFHGGGGYGVARKEISIDFPDNYEISFWIRGTVPRNNLEFKIIDPSGDNVWWVNRRDFAFPDGWTRISIRKRHVSFAWGPRGGGDPQQASALEFAITAGSGGKGTVWIDELALTPREAVTTYDLTPALSASVASATAARAMDYDSATAWDTRAAGEARSSDAERPSLTVDFLRNRELGALTIDWDSLDYAASYNVQTSSDGAFWETVYTVADGNGARDYISLPETETRHMRLAIARTSRGRGVALREMVVQPIEWSTSPNAFFTAVARRSTLGTHPRYFHAHQSYWTVVGASGDRREALMNTDGMIESGKAGFSVEPFLFVRDTLIGWARANATQSLAQGDLPIPSVRWSSTPLDLTVTAVPIGGAIASMVMARYRVDNRTTDSVRATLFLALRPFQVNPPWQFLNTTGGVAEVRSIGFDGRVVTVNGNELVIPLSRPTAFGAATFDQGPITDFFRRGMVPPSDSVIDTFGYASGALAFNVDLAPRETREVSVVLAPAEIGGFATSGGTSEADIREMATEMTTQVVNEWASLLGPVSITLPGEAQRIPRTMRSNLAYILINRDSAAIQPGSRSYERSWIRDGALTSAALLRMGHAREVREFIEWYAPFQYPSGKVPCCVDSRGADPVPEHDSHGELIYLIAEYHRFTRDTVFLARMWPHVANAVAYIDSLRAQRMTPEYQAPEKRAYYGLVPQSISHEGYSAKAMHSYWDDLFTLRGLKDAAAMADVLGKVDTAIAFGAKRDEFRRDVMASYRMAMAMHNIDYLPGAVELGDFDATSTTIGVSPGEELAHLPQPALNRTFAKYLENFRKRRDGPQTWDAYTPYELRVVGTFVRLGQKAHAHELLDYFFKDQRPSGWNHWAEVVWRDPATPKFIGDMPHTWVGSDFIRSASDMFAYEREADSSLVVGAGIPESWVTQRPGVAVRNLATHYGILSYGMVGTTSDVRVAIERGVRVPRGGIVVRSPIDRPITFATVDGNSVIAGAGEIVVRRVPAIIVFRY